jgi:hypothetical protein
MFQFLGIAFSPYVGHWTGTAPNAKVPLGNSYSQQSIVRMVEVIAPQFNKMRIKVGVRSHTFGEIANPNSSYYTQLKTLIQNCDFTLCNLYPAVNTATPTAGVNQVGQAFHQIKTAVADINPQGEVMIGETGWSSQGVSFNNTDNNVANLLAYDGSEASWRKIYEANRAVIGNDPNQLQAGMIFVIPEDNQLQPNSSKSKGSFRDMLEALGAFVDLSHNSNPFPRLVSGGRFPQGPSVRNQRFHKGFNGRSIKTAQFYDLNFTVFFSVCRDFY